MERGDQAINATIAAIHYKLANRYSILAAQSGTGTAKLSLVDCGNDTKGVMKLYRVNKVSAEHGKILKKTDMLANTDRQAMQAAAERDDCPICEVWSEGMKVGSVR